MTAKDLRVNTEALQAMSTRWISLARGLQFRSSDVLVAACSSAAAVATGDGNIRAAASALTARVRTGAVKVAEGAMRYTATEANSASKLAALARAGHA